jgi:uncharacterized protein YidB (DUF937 family)
MGLLDDLLAGAASGRGPNQPAQPERGSGGPNAALLALLPIVLSMLASRGAAGSGSREAGPAGGLGDLLGQVLGGGQRGGGLGDLLGQVLGGGGGGVGAGGLGGLGGLLRQFESAGFGEQARSWVSPGQNQPIPADAFGRIFGADGLAAIARKAGLSEGETSTGLSQLLPEIIDRSTPDGRIPDDDQLTRSLQDLMRRLGG